MIPNVSVIIPAYNRRDVIGRAIESVLAQSFQNFEILIGDDGSTDDTSEIVRQYQHKDSRIVLLRWEVNRGASWARNVLIERARSKYIAFLDSDDEWLPEILREQVGMMDRLPDEWCGVCCGARIIKEWNGAAREVMFAPTRTEMTYKNLAMCRQRFITSTCMIRGKCIGSIGLFDTELPRQQDVDFILRLLRDCRMAVITKPLAVIHMAMEKPLADETLRSKLHLLSKHNDEFRRELGRRAYRYINGCSWLEMTSAFIAEGQVLKGIRYLLLAISYTPFLSVRLYGRIVKSLLRPAITTRDG